MGGTRGKMEAILCRRLTGQPPSPPSITKVEHTSVILLYILNKSPTEVEPSLAMLTFSGFLEELKRPV